MSIYTRNGLNKKVAEYIAARAEDGYDGGTSEIYAHVYLNWDKQKTSFIGSISLLIMRTNFQTSANFLVDNYLSHVLLYTHKLNGNGSRSIRCRNPV